MNINHSNTLALKSVLAEMYRQDDKWGANRDLHNFDWNAILGEEVGEVSEATLLFVNSLLGMEMGHVSKSVLHQEFGGQKANDLRTELTQVAAVALQWIEMLDRKNGNNIENELSDTL